jgi:hypothetical protein
MKKNMSLTLQLVLACILILGPLTATAAAQVEPETEAIMWINHLDFLPGDETVITSFNAENSGVGAGLSGLIIETTTLGEDGLPTGDKVIEKGLIVPPWYLVTGVRVCYELSSGASFISAVRIAQVDETPDTAAERLNDDTDLTDPNPVCVNTVMPAAPIDPADGALRLSLRVNFGDTTDRIVLRAVGLYVEPSPDSPTMQAIEGLMIEIDELASDIENHSHSYLTGRGRGHNNTVATTGTADFTEEPAPAVVPFPGKIKKPKKNR